MIQEDLLQGDSKLTKDIEINEVLYYFDISKCSIEKIKEATVSEVLNAMPAHLMLNKRKLNTSIYKIVTQLKRLSEYVPKNPLSSNLYYYKARLSHGVDTGKWSNLAQNGFCSYEITCDHADIISEGGASQVVRTLNPALSS